MQFVGRRSCSCVLSLFSFSYYSVWADQKEKCTDHASTDFLSKIIIKFPALSVQTPGLSSPQTLPWHHVQMKFHYYGLYVTFRLFIILYDFSFHREFSYKKPLVLSVVFSYVVRFERWMNLSIWIFLNY